MTIQDLSRPEGWFSKSAGALLELLWSATLVMSFAFAAILALSLAVSLVADANLIKIPDRVCYPDFSSPGAKQICT